MRFALPLLLITTLALSACQSRWNPVNWFGSDEPVPDGTVNPLIPPKKEGLASRPDYVYPGIPVETVKSVKVERVPEGAMIVVVGVAHIHGAHTVKLQPRNGGEPENGVLSYDLLAIHPRGAPTGGPEQSRELTVAHVVTTQQLEGVRTIQVIGQSNSRQVRR